MVRLGNQKRACVMVLPPGYEDAMLCREGDQAVYHNPAGLLGAASSFWKCERPDHSTYSGMWIGSRVPTPTAVGTDHYVCVHGDCSLFRGEPGPRSGRLWHDV